MSATINHRSEILFLYDVRDANPNGDPLDENKPRIDDETEQNIVTDVRLKRTVRDYIDRFCSEKIFIKEEKNKDGKQKTREERIKDLFDGDVPDEREAVREALFSTFVDLRLFGATIAVEKGTVTAFGPVQFKFGRSLHAVKPQFIKGTTVMPSREDVEQGTMTEYYVLPYSLVAFHGIANENAAKETGMSEADLELLMEGLWEGTKNLITRSKFGQLPRLLLRVEYSKNNFYIGELEQFLSLKSDKPDPQLRNIRDCKLDITALGQVLADNAGAIKTVNLRIDPAVSILANGQCLTGKELLSWLSEQGDFNVEEIS